MALMDEKDIAAGQSERSAYRLNTVATKISGQELVNLKALAARRRQSTSDLIRELILAELERDSGPSKVDPILSEIVGVRLLLVNLLRPQATGQAPYSTVGFEALLDQIKQVKRQVALAHSTRLHRRKQQMKWGRNESVIWPPHGPVNTYGAIFLSFVACVLFCVPSICVRTHATAAVLLALLRALRHRRPDAQSGQIRACDGTRLGKVPRVSPPDDDVISRKKKPAPGPKQLPLELSPAGISKGLIYVYQQPKTSYLNKPLNNYFQATIYGGENLWDIFYWPVLFGLATLAFQLPFSVTRDVARRRELRYGRRLRGPERLTPKEFNQKVQGDGIGIKTDYMKDMLRIPARAEAQHIQVIGDTGAGKTTIVLQVLRQIRARGDSAIIYDPALEFTRRFYEPSRGDVILNPLDKRCPYWGPSEELRRSSEADALAVSLFQHPQDKKGEFFVEIPQQIFAHLLRYGPSPKSSSSG